MKGYGQFCPVAKAAEVFCERWTALIVRDLGAGSTRFSELQRGVPLMSRSMLSQRLQRLENEGVIERRPKDAGRGWTYHLTPAGREFLPVVKALGVWGQRWSRRELADGEVDVSQLLWAMERFVRADAFGDRRTVVQFEFPDQPPNKRRWWFVNEAGEVHLCVKDPGFEVDLYLSARLLESPDQQVSLTDPDARSMATSGRGSGVVGYNVQVAVETEHHLIVAHEVTNVGSDRAQLAAMAREAKAVLRAERLDAVADRGYFNSEEILACEQAGITVTLPKPMTSGAKAEGRFGKQDFVYQPDEDVYHCPAGATLKYRYTNVENGLTLRRYWTTACPSCPIKRHCTPAKQRRITRWEHEPILEAVQRRLDENPKAMRQRRETVEHPFGTIKARMGATHFLMKTLPRVSGEMALHVLAYNLTRVMNIVGSRLLIAAIRA